MKLAPALIALLLAAAPAPRGAFAAPDGQQAAEADEHAPTSLAEVGRAFTTIDDGQRKGELGRQRSRWSAVEALRPDDVAIQALAAYALPHTEENWSELKALATRHPGSATPLVAMGRVYLEWGVLDQLDRVLPRARAAEPGNWLVELVAAQLAERRGQAAPAVASYRLVLAADADNVDAHVGLARLALAARDQAMARLEAEAALSQLPSHAPALQVLATLAEERGDTREAAELYARLLLASSRDRPARLRLARLLDARGDTVGAREQYRAALALQEDAETLLALADAALRTKDTRTESRALERLSQLDPGGAEWRRIAEIRAASSDTAGAEKALRQAVSRDPKDLQSRLALGRLLAGSGRSQEALEHLRAAGEPGEADRAALEKKLNLVKQTRPDVNALQQSVGALIERTYRGRPKGTPRPGGRLVLKVTSDAAGHAALVEVLEDSLHDDEVRACAYWNLKDAAYPPNKPGRFSFSFALRPAR